MKNNFKLKSYKDFIKNKDKLPKIEFVKLSNEEFKEIIRPIICRICQRLFNSNRIHTEKTIEEMTKITLDECNWEINIANKL